MTEPMDREVITSRQAAEMLGVTSVTITRYVNKGDLEGYKVNPRRSNSPFRIYKDSVEALIRERLDLNEVAGMDKMPATQ